MSVGVGVIGAGMMGTDHVRTLADGGGRRARGRSRRRGSRRARRRRRRAAGARAFADPHALIADPDGRRGRRRLLRRDARGVRARLHRGRQARAVREAAGHHRRGAACTSSTPRSRPAAGSSASASCGASTPATAPIKRGLENGGVGDVLVVHCAHRNAAAPAIYTSEMLITSSAVHEIDIVRWLLGRRSSPPRCAPRARRSARTTACAIRSSCCSRPRAACSSTSRCSSTLSTATTSAASWWARPARCGSPEQVAPDFRARFATAYQRELDGWVQGLGRPARARGTATPPTRSPTPAWSRSPRASERPCGWPSGPPLYN